MLNLGIQVLAVVLLKLCALVTDDHLPCSGVQGGMCECNETRDQMRCMTVSTLAWDKAAICHSFFGKQKITILQRLLKLHLSPKMKGGNTTVFTFHYAGENSGKTGLLWVRSCPWSRSSVLASHPLRGQRLWAGEHPPKHDFCGCGPFKVTLTGYHSSGKLKDVLKSDFWHSQGLPWVMWYVAFLN